MEWGCWGWEGETDKLEGKQEGAHKHWLGGKAGSWPAERYFKGERGREMPVDLIERRLTH